MAELKKIKVRYAGKCADCGRELREGWDAWFDSDGKKLYCTKCKTGTEQSTASNEQLNQFRAILTQLGIAIPEPEPEPQSLEQALFDHVLELHGRMDLTLESIDALNTKLDLISKAVGDMIPKSEKPKKESA